MPSSKPITSDSPTSVGPKISEVVAAYPLPVYNYRVEIDSVTVGFSEVSGLSIAYETTTYKESRTGSGIPGPRVVQMPSQRTPPTISLKKGVVRKESMRALYAWIKTVQVHKVEKKNVVIRLCDEKGAVVLSWRIKNAFPTKLDAPTFDASSNDAAIQTMELLAESIEIEET